eukprot:9610397-Alexandrium_andersonii.AAC.1
MSIGQTDSDPQAHSTRTSGHADAQMCRLAEADVDRHRHRHKRRYCQAHIHTQAHDSTQGLSLIHI